MNSITSPRLLRAFAVSACLAVVGLSGAQSPAFAAKTKTCSVKTSPKYPNKNPGGYFTSLKVRGVSCASGRNLMTKYYRCRTKNRKGIEGRCKRGTRINGLKCTESRPRSGRRAGVEFNARVTCTKGSKRVVHTYQQNL